MSIEDSIFLGLFIGIIAYILLYLGKGIEKYAVEKFKRDKKDKVNLKSKNSGIWIIGSILTIIYFFIQWAALLFAPINLIAPLEGIGLIVLVVFSFYILKEEISKLELFGILIIIIGTTFVALFNPNKGIINTSDFKIEIFVIITISLIVLELVLLIISKFKDYKGTGLIGGFTAGTFLALSTVTKRITAIPNSSIIIVFTILTLIFGIMAKAFSQLAYAKGKANIVIPCFTSTSIIIAILIGILSLNEKIELMQIIGIVLIVGGIILLTAFKKNEN
ncbi:MAG: DMT family transporter [Candidatus Hermodarchaeota archaeon]